MTAQHVCPACVRPIKIRRVKESPFEFVAVTEKDGERRYFAGMESGYINVKYGCVPKRINARRYESETNAHYGARSYVSPESLSIVRLRVSELDELISTYFYLAGWASFGQRFYVGRQRGLVSYAWNLVYERKEAATWMTLAEAKESKREALAFGPRLFVGVRVVRVNTWGRARR